MLSDLTNIFVALILVVTNGFFVAAEFAFIKVRPQRLAELVREGRPFAKTAHWLQQRLDRTLAACQFGITMASLALGWVGEPAFAHLVEPIIGALTDSDAVLHGVSFVLAFSTITTLHLIAGEQVPKIFAIRRPEQIALRCAPVMKASYYMFYPFLWALSWSTAAILKRLGVDEQAGHDSPHTEDEIRALMAQARTAGELTRTEHRLLNAVFEFDDTICRRIMVPRSEVEYFRLDQPIEECLELVRRTKHTRFPLCTSSLDDVIGVVHIKDLIGAKDPEAIDLRAIARPPQRVPETMQISRLLRQFQAIRQHFAFVVDEFGNVIGVVTLENVLEQIVGPVEDEFDMEQPSVVAEGSGQFLAPGRTSITDINKHTTLSLPYDEVDTLSGFVTARLGRLPIVGDKLEVEGATIEVLEVSASRANKVRIHMQRDSAPSA